MNAVTRDLRDWQLEALTSWKKNGRRGIARVVTGGGKTVFAFQCIHDFLETYGSGVVAIVVPSVALQDQWYAELLAEMNVAPSEISLVGGGNQARQQRRFTIAVLNSARKAGWEAMTDPALLIVDECHRAGSNQNRRAIEGSFGATLGLSATPEREYDDGFEEVLVPALGPIIYEYDYVRAHREGVISDFDLTNIEVPLTSAEEEEYGRLTQRVIRAHKRFEATGDDTQLRIALQKRASVTSNAVNRIPTAISIAHRFPGKRMVIFHESIDAANEIAAALIARGHHVALYHTKIGGPMRRDNLRLFREGIFQILVSCRALDEGINVPETEVGVIASSTASSRQRIQRLGRLLRPAPGKSSAQVFTLYATESEQKRLRAEATQLAGVSRIRWMAASIRHG